MEVPKMSKNECPENKLEWLRSQIIGDDIEFTAPFGKRRLTYADFTATSRSLRFIHDYISNVVLPFYGNTHTIDSYVGQHTTKMVEEATKYIKRCMGGGENDAILFCGSGSTASIKRLQEVLGITVPSTLRNRVSQLLRNEERWVVFVGPYEHHSNLLSWRQSLAEVVEIGFTRDGGSIDLEELRHQLEIYGKANRPMLGSFSACSNVTGIVTDTRALARLLHEFGAFACFDFAASGPYVKIEMKSGEIEGYDAVFVSPHKFIGGPGSPGILLMSKTLYQLNNSAPSTCGGGTVSYVNGFNEEDTLYYDDVEERENAGTPPILQTVTAALAFWIKEFVGYKIITKQEHDYMTKAMERLGSNPNIHILGNTRVKRLPILSFLIYPTPTKCTSEKGKKIEKPLNGNFVTKLLNDLFGIQARGGCACAGPYGHYLLNVDRSYSFGFRSSIQKGYGGVKPGWTRVSFPYYMSMQDFEFIVTAIEFVAMYGHRFLSLYYINWKNGEWSFKEKTFKDAIYDERIKEEKYEDNSYLKLTKLLQELKLRPSEGGADIKGVINVEDISLRNKHASYLKTAMYLASHLPNNVITSQTCVPKDLLLELPFIV